MRWILTYLRTAGDNFHVVVPGVLYRSATPSPENLQKWQRKYKIATWIDLRQAEDFDGDRRTPTDKSRFFERQMGVARHLGIERVWLPISDRTPTSDEDVRSVMQVLEGATKDRPVLVACQGGRHRTGLAIALYRMRVQGWPATTPDEKGAFDEAEKRGFYDHGHEAFGARFRQLLGIALCLVLAIVPAFGQHPFIQPDLQAQASAAAVRRADEIRQQNAASAQIIPADVSDDERFNWTFALGSLGYWGSFAADIKSTKGSLDRGSIELNPIFGRDRGRKVRYTANAVASAGIYAVAVYAEKKGHRRFARALLFTGTVIRGAAAIWNHNRRR